MPENYKRFIEALTNDKALVERFDAEKARLLQEPDVVSDAEVVVKAAAALGFELTKADLDRARASMEELDVEALEMVSGGADPDDRGKACDLGYSCWTILLHDQYWNLCWSDFYCIDFSKN